MSRGEGAILGKFGAISRGFNSFVALTPGSSPTAWARGEPHADLFGVLKRQLQRGGSFASALHSPPRRVRERGARLIRVHRLSSLCAGRARFFALTPSPSPTVWERGVGAHGSAPCSAFPLSRPAGEGDTGGEGKKARLPVHACAGKVAPASAILCRTDVPLPGGARGVRATRRDGACPRAKSAGIPPPAVEPYPNIWGGNAWTLASYTYICTQSLAY
jgi:hypothetical protein